MNVCCKPETMPAATAMPHMKSCRDHAWALEKDGKGKCGIRSPFPTGAWELDTIADDAESCCMPTAFTKSCRDHMWANENDGKTKCGHRGAWNRDDKQLDRRGDNVNVCCKPEAMPAMPPAGMPARPALP
jgi:hypothetical protein